MMMMMSVFNNDDENSELKHPAFHDEVVIKEQNKVRWPKVLDFLFVVFMVLGFVAWVLFCVWINYFK